MTILITRPEPEASELDLELQARSYQTWIDSLLRIHPTPPAAIHLNNVQALVFTSANAVRALTPLQLKTSMPTYVVGEATKSAALDHGFRVIDTQTTTAFELSQYLIDHLNAGRGKIIHFSGQELAVDIIHILSQKHFTTERQIVYQADAVQSFKPQTIQALENQAIQQVLFFSPRTARIFVKLIQKQSLEHTCQSMAALCLSQNVAHALEGTFWQHVLIAKSPQQKHMLDLLNTTKETHDRQKTARQNRHQTK